MLSGFWGRRIGLKTIAKDRILKSDTEEKYEYFDGEKAYQFPVYSERDSTKANRYPLGNGDEFWVDARTMRVATTDPDLYLQTLLRFNLGNIVSRLILCIDGRRVQVSKFDGLCLDLNPPRNAAGVAVWKIEEIGSPLYYFTGHDDARAGIKRPFEERYQVLTNASTFESREQQDRGLAFLTAALEKYGNVFSDGPAGGNDMPAAVSYSKELTQAIKDGDLIDG